LQGGRHPHPPHGLCVVLTVTMQWAEGWPFIRGGSTLGIGPIPGFRASPRSRDKGGATPALVRRVISCHPVKPSALRLFEGSRRLSGRATPEKGGRPEALIFGRCASDLRTHHDHRRAAVELARELSGRYAPDPASRHPRRPPRVVGCGASARETFSGEFSDRTLPPFRSP